MYTAKLSEQSAIVKGGVFKTATNATTTVTLTSADMREYHRVRPVFFVAVTSTTSATTAQTASAEATATIQSIKVLASSSTGFTSSTTVKSSTSSSTLSAAAAIGASTKATSTALASTFKTISVDGEDVQAARGTKLDRYIKAKVKVKVASGAGTIHVAGFYEKGEPRNHPA